MFTLQSLRAFVAVFEHGKVTLAAQIMGITQPQVSRLVAELETELGFQLFTREGKRLVPTARAMRFYAEACQLLAAYSDLGRVARELRREKDEPLRILAPAHVAHSIVPLALSSLRHFNPECRIRLDELGRNVTGGWSVYKPFDVGVSGSLFDLPWARKTALASGRLLVLMPKGHPLALRDAVRDEDLLHYPLVLLNSHAPLRQLLEKEFAGWGRYPDVMCEMDTLVSICDMVRGGAGITLIDPLSLAQTDFGSVVAIPWERPVTMNYCSFVPNHSGLIAMSPWMPDFMMALRACITDLGARVPQAELVLS